MKTQLQLVIIIASKNLGNKVCSAISEYGYFPSVLRGRGTAPNSVVAALGLGEPEKDIVFCFAEKRYVEKIYGVLLNDLDFQQKRSGIAMSIPINAVGGELSLKILTGKTYELKENKADKIKRKLRISEAEENE